MQIRVYFGPYTAAYIMCASFTIPLGGPDPWDDLSGKPRFSGSESYCVVNVHRFKLKMKTTYFADTRLPLVNPRDNALL